MSEIEKITGLSNSLSDKIEILKDELIKYEKILEKITIKIKLAQKKEALLGFITYFFWFLVVMFSIGVYLELFPVQCERNSGYSLIECSNHKHKYFPLLVLCFFSDLIVFFIAFILSIFNSRSNRITNEDEKEEVSISNLILKINTDLDKARKEKKDILLEYEKQNNLILKIDKELEKECPMCAEFIKSKAKICRFCSHNF